MKIEIEQLHVGRGKFSPTLKVTEDDGNVTRFDTYQQEQFAPLIKAIMHLQARVEALEKKEKE